MNWLNTSISIVFKDSFPRSFVTLELQNLWGFGIPSEQQREEKGSNLKGWAEGWAGKVNLWKGEQKGEQPNSPFERVNRRVNRQIYPLKGWTGELEGWTEGWTGKFTLWKGEQKGEKQKKFQIFHKNNENPQLSAENLPKNPRVDAF